MTMTDLDAGAADAELLRELYPDLRRFAAVVGPREVGPDDLVHDAIVATIAHGTLQRLDNPGAYLRRAIVHLASNERRRLGRLRTATTRLRASTETEAYDAYPADLAHLEMLDPRDRAVLYLHDIEGETFEAIGHALDLTAANARQIASRTRLRLRAHIENEEQS